MKRAGCQEAIFNFSIWIHAVTESFTQPDKRGVLSEVGTVRGRRVTQHRPSVQIRISSWINVDSLPVKCC